ncbi:hypothetical protein COLO4_04569 [Corchorus olitorius]|uniref:Uncharacterized protein n=1 Tax=Corchorus olitorius TaxID=93759 RepID=A0A1R3KTJ6_9ROSI|nr:hypothetical protein COLO4_04569 [Corchorus olitorius]
MASAFFIGDKVLRRRRNRDRQTPFSSRQAAIDGGVGWSAKKAWGLSTLNPPEANENFHFSLGASNSRQLILVRVGNRDELGTTFK